MKRTVAAFLIAPAVPAVAFMSSAGLGLGLVISYSLSYVLGIPVFFVLRKIKKETHACYLMAGFFMGAAYILVPALFYWSVDALLPALIFGVTGSITALIFSLIRGDKRNRPNQSPQTRATSGPV